MTRTPAALILAAGKGTRMRSALPKVLHPLLGRPLIHFPLALAAEIGAAPVVAVIGHGGDAVRQAMSAALPANRGTSGTLLQFGVQTDQRGTGDAVRVGLEALGEFEGPVLILSGDVPLLRRETIDSLLALPGAMAMATAMSPTPQGYGRIVRGAAGQVERVVEERDATSLERARQEINAGLYRIDAGFLRAHLQALKPANAQGELYLTDLVARAAAAGSLSTLACSFAEVAGINNRADLAAASAALRARVNLGHQLAGVTLIDPASVLIDLQVEIEADVVIEPHCQILGGSRLGQGTRVKSHSVLEDAVVGPECVLGPFARLRPGTELARGVHLGNFVETKKARIGPGSKANHLSYLGDADIGAGVNIGAGTITCNYDGVHKYPTVIGDGVFIGSDSQLVAPVRVEAGAYVAAGSTIARDVPADSLVLTRAPLTVKPGWAARRRAQRNPKA